MSQISPNISEFEPSRCVCLGVCCAIRVHVGMIVSIQPSGKSSIRNYYWRILVPSSKHHQPFSSSPRHEIHPDQPITRLDPLSHQPPLRPAPLPREPRELEKGLRGELVFFAEGAREVAGTVPALGGDQVGGFAGVQGVIDLEVRESGFEWSENAKKGKG